MTYPIRYSLVVTCLLFIASPSFGQGFGDILKALQQGRAPAPNVGQAKSAEKQGQASFGAKATENYCKNLFSVAAIENRGPISEALVSEEFNFDPKDFFDEVLRAMDAKPGFSSYTFPSPYFYANEFETDKVDVLFNMLLSYPSPKYAAALIAESRTTQSQPQYDHQAKVDATVALAILHFRMQDKSKSPGRWKELVASLKKEEHYTSKVIWARLLKSGEMGSTDVTQSITLAVEANGLRSKYSSDNGYKTMSPRNYQITSNQTLYETLVANPSNSQRRYFDQFIKKYQEISNSSDPVPELKAQLGPGILAIEKAANSAARKAGTMLSGATEAGNIKAQKASLDSATRTRVSDSSDVNADTRALAAVARELGKIDKLSENQKVILADAMKDAHESGDRAISMMGPMMNAMMNVMMRRGMEAMPAVLPYASKIQAHSDNACTVVSRLDHAAMVKSAPAEPERNTLASMMDKQ